jgi:hypothetical protein
MLQPSIDHCWFSQLNYSDGRVGGGRIKPTDGQIEQ